MVLGGTWDAPCCRRVCVQHMGRKDWGLLRVWMGPGFAVFEWEQAGLWGR